MLSCKRDAVEWENRVVRVHKAFELKFAVVVLLVLVTTTTTADNYPHCAVLLLGKAAAAACHSLFVHCCSNIYIIYSTTVCAWLVQHRGEEEDPSRRKKRVDSSNIVAAWTTGLDPSSGFVQQTILWFDVYVPIINSITLSVVMVFLKKIHPLLNNQSFTPN